jgi:hypothetical protein
MLSAGSHIDLAGGVSNLHIDGRFARIVSASNVRQLRISLAASTDLFRPISAAGGSLWGLEAAAKSRCEFLVTADIIPTRSELATPTPGCTLLGKFINHVVKDPSSR